ncbi:two-component system VirA-like sensor kinase [Bradyrhizobium sp. SYSU BS000235]|uniref:two-component system VirA-like sensor kinase n=1 Tax=Bradyrhizobium sp. SYSU BS000235 TaxID=3411332 RepID=UPI003C759A0A
MKASYYTSGVVLVLLGALTWLLMSGLNLNSARYDQEMRALDDFLRFERGLHREVLTARAGLSRNYDALVRMSGAVEDALQRLRTAAGPNAPEIRPIQKLEARAEREFGLIEQFKTKNALLQNSVAYFGLLTARLVASDNKPVAGAATRLAGAMLLLTIDTSPTAMDDVQDRLNELSTIQWPAGDHDAIVAILAHGGMLRKLLPDINTLLRALVSEADNRQQDVVRALIVKRQLAARASARTYRVWLYATSLLLVVFLVILGLQLRKRAVALERQAAFERTITDISMGFISSQHHELTASVERALRRLAEFIDADRAYFVLAEPAHAYQWTRKGAEFPKNWSAPMLDHAFRIDAGKDGIIRTSGFTPTHAPERDVLAACGLQSWLCVRSVGKRADAILGFDGLNARSLGCRDDRALFRMAFDAIANAVDRALLEQEKEKLEASLQRAERMETIGTFASGIAHNFNNIVAAIHGYTEIAETRVALGKDPGKSLMEIHRASERARELVEQILRFGRRGEGKRQTVSVKAVVCEAASLLRASLPRHISLSVTDLSDTAVLSGEAAQLQQVILNLCNNAAQAMTAPGTIGIRIAAEELTQARQIARKWLPPGRFTTVEISDPGKGMDQATMERIFEPFFTTRSDGNGLGLATVREIVEDHRGAVEVQSALGVGTRFTLWLPSTGAPHVIAPSAQHAVSDADFGKTVLVLDLDPERLLRHEEIVAALGFEPIGFTTCQDAEEACRSGKMHFDAALVFHEAGNAALKGAAVVHSAAPQLPIILATASTRDLDASQLASSGVAELVRYPLTSTELANALSRCLPPSPSELVWLSRDHRACRSQLMTTAKPQITAAIQK